VKVVKDGDELLRMLLSDKDDILKELWQKLHRFGHVLHKTCLYVDAAGNLG